MPKLKHLSDSELILLLDRKDKDAFTEIYERYWDSLLLHARKMLKDDDEIFDVLQQVFTALWMREAELNINTSLASYLYASVRNLILNKIVRSKIHQSYLSSFANFVDGRLSDADFGIREKQLSEKIELEIEKLPAKMREIFLLSRKQNLGYKEISRKLNITDHTVKKQINNALKILKMKLKNFYILMI